MKITKIERQKKNKSRFSIFIDEKYAFSISENVYARFVPFVGQELTATDREKIEAAEAESTVKQAALRFRSYRPRSTKEVSDYLRKKGYDEAHIQLALSYLQENRLLNDEEFARMLCRDMLVLKPLGRHSMKQLLIKKGLHRELIESTLSECYSTASEHDLAMREGKKKYQRVASLPPLSQKKRIYEHLMRRGYDSSISMAVASELVHA